MTTKTLLQGKKELPLKNKKVATSLYYRERLRDYILENPEFIFSKENEADSWQDFVRFPTMRTDREHLCLPNEPFLVDRNVGGEHMFCVCTISEKGRVTNQFPVIAVEELPYGVWRNGYFLLPDFLKNHPDHD